VKWTLGEHPFRELLPFDDYLKAHFIVHETDNSLRRSFRERLDAKPYLPTPILAWCLVALSMKDGKVRIRASDFGFLCEAWLTHPCLGSSRRIHVATGGNETVAVVDGADWIPEIHLVEPREGIWFWRRLECAIIDVTWDVHLGVEGGEFSLGPSVVLECPRVECKGSILKVGVRENDGEVILRSSFSGQPAIRVFGDDKRFQIISSGDVAYPWSTYKRDCPPPPPSDDQLLPHMMDLRRLVTRFRAQGYGELALAEGFFDNFVVGQDDGRRGLYEYCRNQGLFRVVDGKVVLDSGGIDRLGLEIAPIRDGVMTPRVKAFLSAYHTTMENPR